MLAKDPHDRPVDADIVATRLEAVLLMRTSAAGQTAPPETRTSLHPDSADDGESTVTSEHPQAPRIRQDPQVEEKQRVSLAASPKVRPAPRPPKESDVIQLRRPTVVTRPPPSPFFQPQLQVAPSSGSWSLLAFDPSGRWLASADGDGTITL